MNLCDIALISCSICYALGVKKPAGTAEEIEKHFGCKSSQLIMVDKNSLDYFKYMVLLFVVKIFVS